MLGLLTAFRTTAQYSEQDLIDEANSLFEKGEYAAAMPLYSQLLSLNPTNPTFNYRFGATALYGDAEKKEEAVKFLKFAAGKTEVDEDAWYFLGRAYHLNYLFADAIKAYEKYKSLASKSDLEKNEVDLNIAMARSGQNLLSQIKEITVVDRKPSSEESFFRIYDLSDIGGKILVTPEELLSEEDKKRKHTSLIHFRGTGTTVYFSSYGKSGKNGLDIYRAEVLPDGTFTEPTPVVGPVNTPHDEDFPYLHPDDKTFYFSSKGHGSMGGFDVYKSAFDIGSGVFSKPVNLDFAVNTPDDDLFYIADSLNEMAYFASARRSKQGELDVYKVLVKSAPLDITLIKGTFINQINADKKLAKITTIDAATNEEVDVQFTDPETGEYVLSFPRGGKYKFLVEEKESDKIHAGLVDVPNSDGVNAFLQEMELISTTGVEKLLINNLFDQSYEGDVLALAQKMLRQRAALDINFDPSAQQEQGGDMVSSSGKDPSKAYADAGFGGGMNNETILEQAEAHVEELKNRQILSAQIASVAADSAEAYFAEAQNKHSDAEFLVDKVSAAGGENKNADMFEAGIKKVKGETALRSAFNSKNLSDRLYEQSIQAEEEYRKEKLRVDVMREAIDSNDYDAILASLQEEKAARDEVGSSKEKFDLVQDFRRTSLKIGEEADQLVSRAQRLRNQEEEMNKTLITRRTQSTKMKGKAKKAVDEEIVILESDIESMRRKSERAFQQAQEAQESAKNFREEYLILEELSDGFTTDRTIPAEAPSVTWSGEDRATLAEELANLAIDNDAITAYAQENPAAFQEMPSEAFAMEFRRSFGAIAGLHEATEEYAESAVSKSETEEIQGVSQETPSTSSEETLEELASNIDPEKENFSQDPKDSGAGISEPAIGLGIPAGAVLALSENANSEEPEAVQEYGEIDYDESLPTEKRVEAEEFKIQAAEDWIAIIDESIAQLESGAGGEEGAEEQLEDYKKLKAQKENEIAQRTALIESWYADTFGMNEEAMSRAQADVDSLSPSLVARLESKIPDYSTETKSIKAVSLIDRDYLPALTEIEISGLSAPELAEERIRLNQQLIAHIDQIMTQGIESEVSDEDLLEMRRIKTLEIAGDQEVMEGLAEFKPRSSEAKEYADLIHEVILEEEPQLNAEIVAGEEYTELSPAIVATLEKEYSKDLILPDYTAMVNEAELTTNPEVASAQRMKIKEEFLVQLQSEITLYKAAIDGAENPNPSLVNRYGILLTERSDMIDDLNIERAQAVEGFSLDPVIAFASADSVISSIENGTLLVEMGQEPSQEQLNSANDIVTSQIDEYIDLLDNPEIEVDRDQLQQEIQTLEAFQRDLLALNSEKNQLVGSATENLGREGSNSESTSVPSSAETDEFATILSISEGFVFDFDTRSNEIKNDEDLEKRELEALASLNDAFVESIDFKIDSLQGIRDLGSERFRNIVNEEIAELEALSANKKQESDRLRAEVELLSISDGEETTASNSLSTDDLRYKSLNASIIQDNLKVKSDSVNILREQYANATKNKEKRKIQEKMDRIDAELVEGTFQANIAEIEYYQTENERILSQIDLDKTSRKNEILALENQSELLSTKMMNSQDQQSIKNQKLLILELAEINNELIAFDRAADAIPPSAALSEVSTALLQSESHEGLPNRAYMTSMQSEIVKEISDEERQLIESSDPLLSADYTFGSSSKAELKKELISQKTKVDDIGMSLLSETPLQLDYLAATIAADSLKHLENLSAQLAESKQAEAIERSSEANRLLGTLTGQKSSNDQAEIQERAKKLETEAEVLYKQSAIAAERAEAIRNERSAKEQELVALSTELSFKERSALNQLLRTPAYNIISSEETVGAEQAQIQSSPESTSKEENIADVPPSNELGEKTIEAARKGSSINEDDELTLAEKENFKNELTTSEISDESSPKSSTALADIKGNWLAMVEIIAEKEDFSDVKESMFVEANNSLYSANNPIPLDPVMPSGLIFQVQVGAFRNPIPQDLFGAYAPIMGQKLDNGITRYRAGLFKKYDEAIQARDEIRVKGYSDAFVVVYVDGNKLTGDQARDIVARAKTNETLTVQLVSGVSSDAPIVEDEVPITTEESVISSESKGVKTPDYYNDPNAADASQVEVINGLFYTVQVGVYSKPVKLVKLYNLTELNSELTQSGVIRYTSGRFGDLSAASTRKARAIEKGVEDAFITAYYNGKRISLSEAQRILNEVGDEALTDEITGGATKPAVQQNEGDSSGTGNGQGEGSSNGESYVVIMGTFAGAVPEELANLFLENEDWGIRRIEFPGAGAIYLTEEMESLKDARTLLEECKRLNIGSASIGTMKDGQITSVQID